MAAYKCRFENNHHDRVIVKLIGAENQYTAELDPTEVAVAQGSSAIVEGHRVVIAWNETSGQILDFRKINIDREWQFAIQANSLFAIGTL